MPAWTVVPTWFDIEKRIAHNLGYQSGATYHTPANGIGASVGLNVRRIANLRTAFTRAESETAGRLSRRFSDLDIGSITNDLIDTVTQMVMIVAGSVLTGGAIGAGVGAFFGGAGAVPAGAAGAAMGLKVSTWILGTLGLMSIAEFFVEGLPRIGEYYLTGISIVWRDTRGDHGLIPFGGDDHQAIDRAADQIAKGHEEMVLLLLGAIVAYLTRGRGNASVLASEMQGSSKGARLGQWMLKHEEALKKRPDLQRPEPSKRPPSREDAPAPTPSRRTDQSAPKKPLGMPEHRVPCFNVSPKHLDRIPEFDRQLAGQQRGLNDLTVDEYLKGREAFTSKEVVRDPNIAKAARERFTTNMVADLFRELRSKDFSVEQAKQLANQMASEKMETLAALHNPDLFAGGKDTINDFGDRRINSSIGPQWSSRISGLDVAAKNIRNADRGVMKINAKLERCR
ncbi:hypothetical protein N015_25210 [Pseudomonas asturiensis]|uniref:Novel toxin 15 n=1 Tax=Pseudomonas asturiensis TaxID=1190415 RepID=A0ABX6HIX4_9PSED|nr:polymorphic toxin type 15 domain-containing protein [Pseudomonas asturiensis]QHF05529.1 hypothetical protein N015_25210 [Pseudomonas asturiensis]